MTDAQGTDVEPEVTEPEDVEPEIEVLSGGPDAVEIAAITAVLSEVLDELVAEEGRMQQAAGSAWGRSQRSLRQPLHAQAGAWRSFSG